QFLGCRLISWQCKKQTVVATLSTEAEYVAAASYCAQVLWIQNQLLDYGANENWLIVTAVSSKFCCLQADDVADEGAAGVDVDVVPAAAAAEPFIPSPTPTTQPPPPPSQELPSTSQVAQALEIIKLKQRVKKLESKNKLKVSGLRRLREVGTVQRVESSTDTVMDDQEDASKQREIIANIDADKDVILKDVAAVEKDAEIKENADA
nr:putative ribonuclease H-like domain-containing protein [Tanacetum cinerariifolium]